MKKSDFAMIILIASVSVMVAFLVVNQIPALKPDEKGVKVPTAEAIVSDVGIPDVKVFNAEAVNPTVQTVIGGGSGTAQ